MTAKVYAQRDTAIDGKHFKSGEEIKDVASEQLALAVRQGHAGKDKPAVTGAPDASEKN